MENRISIRPVSQDGVARDSRPQYLYNIHPGFSIPCRYFYLTHSMGM